MTKRFDHTGSTLDSFLEKEGILGETEAVALKRVLAWQLKRAMGARRISKNAMARQMRTSRSQVDRLLDPLNVAVSLESVARAAKVVGKSIDIRVVEGAKPARTSALGRSRGVRSRQVRSQTRKAFPKAV